MTTALQVRRQGWNKRNRLERQEGMEEEDGMAQDGGKMRRGMGTRESRLEQ